MTSLRIAMGLGLAAATLSASPASAQFFLQSRDMTSNIAVKGDEPGSGIVMPGATPAELRAVLIWNMRAALNVAALQCQFAPTLLTVDNYNAILRDHGEEIQKAFDAINKYYLRTNKTKAAGQAALDQFGTRTYSSFTTVAAQYGFCQTAHSIGRDAIFTPRGQFGDLASARTRELRNSLVPWGEQRFPRYIGRDTTPVVLPRLDPICWNKKNEWVTKKCGVQNWPPAPGIGVATR